MKVKKLKFKEMERREESNFIPFVAESPVCTYYIDYDKRDQTYGSYATDAEIGEDKTFEDAVRRVNNFHKSNILACME